MGWRVEEFGGSHDGRAVAVLADGTEPGPVIYDTGSSGSVHRSSEWWIYDGTLRAPLATHLRGGCSCGWRGTDLHAVDWTLLGDRPYDTDPLGPMEDWFLHVRQVDANAVPLPEVLAGLLQLLDEQLTSLAATGPLAALRAVAMLERTAGRTGTEAAHKLAASGTDWKSVAVALGLTEDDAQARVDQYRYGD